MARCESESDFSGDEIECFHSDIAEDESEDDGNLYYQTESQLSLIYTIENERFDGPILFRMLDGEIKSISCVSHCWHLEGVNLQTPKILTFNYTSENKAETHFVDSVPSSIE